MDVIAKLSIVLPYILIGIILIILCILVYLIVIIRATRKRQALQESSEETSEAADDTPKEATSIVDIVPSIPTLQLRESFARAMKQLKANFPGRNYRYQIPWFMMVGEAASGKTTALGNTGLNLPLGKPAEEGLRRTQHCNWWFFYKGTVLDIAGDYVLRTDGKTSGDKGWRSLLRLLRKYRPERPIDGVILTIPCTDIINPQKMSDEQIDKLEEKATLLYNKLWQAQKTLGMCFPLYILVTKCDQITGFKSFCDEIPERLHQDIFGWSSPYALETAYSPHWVDEAVHNICRHLYQTQMEVIADGIQVQDKDGFFLFPAEFQSMLEPLRIFLDNLFKQSAYHEAFFFRGLYFCGDGGGEVPARPILSDEATSIDSPPVSTADPILSASPAQTESASKKPLFLKHLFERKVFPEYGLARPAARKFLLSNLTVRIIQILLLVIALVWGVGLWIGYRQLNGQLSRTQTFLEQTQKRLKEEHSDWSTPQDWLDNMPKTSNLLHAAFIPASWFDTTGQEVEKCIIKAIKYIIIPTIYTELTDEANGTGSENIEQFTEDLKKLKNSVSGEKIGYFRDALTEPDKIKSDDQAFKESILDLYKRLFIHDSLRENIENIEDIAKKLEGNEKELPKLQEAIRKTKNVLEKSRTSQFTTQFTDILGSIEGLKKSYLIKENTYKALLGEILDWINDPDKSEPMEPETYGKLKLEVDKKLEELER
ncbi:MAG: hypothetical protein H8D67_29880 [Deltaproteobacteria bacterium]|nr:hypothetical protein [Deltaproteobacteria bacterium]